MGQNPSLELLKSTLGRSKDRAKIVQGGQEVAKSIPSASPEGPKRVPRAGHEENHVFPGEAGGPGFPLSGHRGLGIGLVLDVYGNLSFSRISNFLSVEVAKDLDSKMAQR